MKCCLGASIPGYGHSRNCLGSAGYYDEHKGTVIRKPIETYRVFQLVWYSHVIPAQVIELIGNTDAKIAFLTNGVLTERWVKTNDLEPLRERQNA